MFEFLFFGSFTIFCLFVVLYGVYEGYDLYGYIKKGVWVFLLELPGLLTDLTDNCVVAIFSCYLFAIVLLAGGRIPDAWVQGIPEDMDRWDWEGRGGWMRGQRWGCSRSRRWMVDGERRDTVRPDYIH